MRRAMMASLCILWLTSAAVAGVYSTAETVLGPFADKTGAQPMPLDLFRDTLGDRIGLTRDPAKLLLTDPKLPENTVKRRKEQEAKLATLQAKAKAADAKIDDLVNLSAAYIHLGKYQEASDLLKPIADGRDERHGREGQSNFMVLSNLATADQRAGQMDRVAAYLQLARVSWPEKWPGITDEQLQFWKQADRYQFRLVMLREGEAKKQPAGSRRPPPSVDALFGDDNPVRYVGADGQYTAGSIAAKEKEKLPRDSLAIVQQLALWLPEDTRLYWLVGEVFNAEGQADDAFKILDECVGAARGYDSPELMDHRRILKEATTPPPPPSVLPETSKLLWVGGAMVAMIVVLGYFQFREVRRRRLARDGS